MKILISPTKKMKIEEDMRAKSLPIFLEESREIFSRLKELSPDELQKLWACNDKILEENLHRLGNMGFNIEQSPAILAYEGLQFQSMKPQIFGDEEFSYVEEHLRILSGLFGLVKPFDSIPSYRLEMQAKLSLGGQKNLYDFWGDKLAKALVAEEGEAPLILNLASKEYSKAVLPHLPEDVRCITCHFMEERAGKLVVQATHAKMARGEMVAFLARNRGESPEDIQEFGENGYVFSSNHSTETEFIFIGKAGK